MTNTKIKELSALCKRWDDLTAERAAIEAQIERLIAPEAKPVEPVTDQIQVGDLVEVVSANDRAYASDIGRGGTVISIEGLACGLRKHDSYELPAYGVASVVDCRKVAAHDRSGAP